MRDIERQRQLLLANLLETMRTFGQVRDNGEIWEDDGLLCIYSGLPGAVFNSVLLTKPVASERELKVKFDYVQALYGTRRARWSLWLVEHLVPFALTQRMSAILESYGANIVSHGAAMYAEFLLQPLRELPQLQVVPVGPPATRFDFCHVMAIAFRTPLNTFLDVYNTPSYWNAAMRGFVAYSGNRALATACVMPAHGVLGVYGVSVLPEVRRKGIGESIVRQALGTVGEATGLTATVLQSSAIAESLYRRMGYRTVAGVSIYNESQ